MRSTVEDRKIRSIIRARLDSSGGVLSLDGVDDILGVVGGWLDEVGCFSHVGDVYDG